VSSRRRELALQRLLARFLAGERGLEQRHRIGGRRRRWGRRRSLARGDGERGILGNAAAQQPRAAQEKEQQRQRKYQRAQPRHAGGRRHGGGDRKRWWVQDGDALRRHRECRRQNRGRGFLLIAPGDDDRLVADQEDERVGGSLRGELQRLADQPGVLGVDGTGERVAQRRDVAQAAIDRVEHSVAFAGIEIVEPSHLAWPVGIPVDGAAVVMRLWVGQEIGRSGAEAAADDAAQLVGAVVQRFAAHAQGAYAGPRRCNQGRAARHLPRFLPGDCGGGMESGPGRQACFAQSRRTNFWTLPVEVIGRSRKTI
jgi:hypothetical protein